MSGERNRQKNFSDHECLELIRSVRKYAHIIECKETGKYKNEQKAAAWDAVCRDYNRRTSYARSTISLRTKWIKDKSNLRDYMQYLKTSQSRSGRTPHEILKTKHMGLLAKVVGMECPEIESVSDVDEFSLDVSNSMNSDVITKTEPMDEMPDATFEEIMVNGNTEQFNYANEDLFTDDSFDNTTPQLRSQSVKQKTARNSSPSHSSEHLTESSNPMNQLQFELLKRQIRVQELMAIELKYKIERSQQLMKMEAAESKLRCEEIKRRLQSLDNIKTQNS